MTLIQTAQEFARQAHAGQTRKYTDEPYITHPEAVVAILVGAGITDETTIAAAYLHDVVEDTPVTLPVISDLFGIDVAMLVEALTDPPAVPGGPNRAARKAATAERLSQADHRSHSIKIADFLDNMPTILANDPKFAVTFMREKKELAPNLYKADRKLFARAIEAIAEYERNRKMSAA